MPWPWCISNNNHKKLHFNNKGLILWLLSSRCELLEAVQHLTTLFDDDTKGEKKAVPKGKGKGKKEEGKKEEGVSDNAPFTSPRGRGRTDRGRSHGGYHGKGRGSYSERGQGSSSRSQSRSQPPPRFENYTRRPTSVAEDLRRWDEHLRMEEQRDEHLRMEE